VTVFDKPLLYHTAKSQKRQEVLNMENTIRGYLGGLKFGRKQVYRNLGVFPLLSTYDLPLEYLILDEALPEGLIEVLETDEDGSVPELRLINRSPLLVLILDGEELVGAKQNRIVNTTILLKEKSTTVIPVSCVEQGRWSYSSEHFRTERRMMSHRLRSRKAQQVNNSVRTSGAFRSDQHALWAGIAEQAERRAVYSPTGAMASIYEKEMPTIQQYVDNFRLIEGQVGAVFMINGRVAGMDAFGKHDTFGKVFKKLLQSYALDAVDWFESEKEHKYLKSKVTGFMKSCLAAAPDPHPSVGMGMDCRMESKNIAGFALVLDSQVLHVSLFAKENNSGERSPGSGMERYSQRRRNRTL
jgi:flavodoxin